MFCRPNQSFKLELWSFNLERRFCDHLQSLTETFCLCGVLPKKAILKYLRSMTTFKSSLICQIMLEFLIFSYFKPSPNLLLKLYSQNCCWSLELWALIKIWLSTFIIVYINTMKTTFDLIFISSQLNFNITVVFIVLILTPVSVLIPISLKSNMNLWYYMLMYQSLI